MYKKGVMVIIAVRTGITHPKFGMIIPLANKSVCKERNVNNIAIPKFSHIII